MKRTATGLSVPASLSGKRVLLTGTTGFLAKVVLEKLIRTVPDVGRVLLLIRRGRHGESARERFEREIATSSVFDRLRAEEPDFLAHFFVEKIECITGEVTEVGFALSATRFVELAGRVDVVINAAASVNFREPLDQALSINALSLHNVTALARAANAPLIQISTCYVNGYNRGDMQERIVVPAGAAIPRHRDGYFDVDALISKLEKKIERLRTEVNEPKLRERRLTELGIREANRYGWNDTYTFTKWIGEQLAMRGMQGRALSIVRPSIIESTLQEPAPGWIEGVKVADAVILAYARGKTRFFPARPQGIIDVIPADLVANSILMASAEAISDEEQEHRIYQCCSGSSNPILLGDMIRMIEQESKRNWKTYDRLFYSEPRHDFRVVHPRLFGLMMGAMSAGVNAWTGLRLLLGASPLKSLEAVRTTQLLALTFSFYTQPRYRFHNTRLMALARRFGEEGRSLFPVDAKLIDWPSYLCRIHMNGLNRYALRRRDSASAGTAARPVMPAVEVAN